MPQIVSPSVPSGTATITERYDALVASGAIERDPAQDPRGRSAHFFSIGSDDVRCDLSYYTHLLREHPWRSRSDGGRISGDLGSAGPVPS